MYFLAPFNYPDYICSDLYLRNDLLMYTVDESADEPIMLLTSQIGQDPEDPNADYIDGARFAAELLRLDTMGKKSIQVYINCPGGSVMDGMNIYNAILKSQTPVDTHNIGIAASMGGVCFMAGRKRIMSDYASLMLHNPSGGDDPGALDSMKDSLSTMLSAKSGITKEDVSGLMECESWLNSSECFAKGFCTEIAVTSEQNKKRMPVQGARAMWKEAAMITNSLFTNENNNMKKITAKLGLTEGAAEDLVLGAIEKIQNDAIEKISALETGATSLKKDLKDAQDKVVELQAKVAAAEQTAKEAKDAQDLIDAAALETAAGEIITNAVKIGKIKNDVNVIASWKAKAILDLPGTKQMIEDLPLSRSAATITNVIPGATGTESAEALKFAGTAAARMFAIENKIGNKK